MDTFQSKWLSNSWYEETNEVEVDLNNLPDIYKDKELVEYESYMKAYIHIEPTVSKTGIDCNIGNLLVIFPPYGNEDNRLHTHPISSRIITVIKGKGQFIFYRNKQVNYLDLSPGSKIYMPRGILHTFRCTRDEEMIVNSIHIPFIPLENKNCLVYPKLNIPF